LEIGPDAKTLSKDKLEDLFLESGGASGFRPASLSSVASGGFLSVAMGAVGSQLFNNIGASTQDGEPIPCGVIGGSSKWLGFKVTTDGTLRIDTIGSSIDTVLAVYYGSSLIDLHYVTCDNNGAPDGIRSVVLFPALEGTNYFVAVDGVGGAQGTNITLNWKFGMVPLVTAISANQSIHLGGSSTLFVVAVSPTPDSSYVWRLNGAVIANATGPNLALNSV